MGNTFNVVFLTLSAFLFGLSYEKKQNKQYDKQFIIGRISKLAYSYYPFLLAMFAFLCFMEYNVSIKNIIMHFAFLPWFDKIRGFGHLWYLTLIIFCYFAIYFVSKLPSRLLKYIKSNGIILLVLAIVSQLALEYVKLPNYIIVYALLYVFIFLNAGSILSTINKLKTLPTIISSSFVVAFIILLYKFEFMTNVTQVWIGLISAVFVMTALMKIFNNASSNLAITFISTISFEIYLVHHVFCFGQYSIYTIIPNPILGTVVILIISILLAIFLRRISIYANKIVNHVYKL